MDGLIWVPFVLFLKTGKETLGYTEFFGWQIASDSASERRWAVFGLGQYLTFRQVPR